MRKIEKLALRKIVEPEDILRKKQMQNLWGGRLKSCCTWVCTYGPTGNEAHGGSGSSLAECWLDAESACTPPETYGIRIVSHC